MSESELRYGFGQNWSEFIERHLSEKIVQDSIDHMKKFMRRESLNGLRVLDIGCGSGIHSLAMKKMGAAEIVAFDYDENSVATSKKVREWSGLSDGWRIEQGSVLDEEYVKSLGNFDLVYSWGVLHHTGSMWQAIKNAGIPLKEDGEFYIALYSSDLYVSPSPEEWVRIKKEYNFAGPIKKRIMEIQQVYNHVIVPERSAGKSWLEAIKSYGTRGMTVWTDAKDWLGGYPMEFASLAETRDFCKREFGLDLVNILYGEGCCEYFFANAKSEFWLNIESGRIQHPIIGPFMPLEGYAWHIHFDEHQESSDISPSPRRSKLMIYEDGVPLGLCHSVHEEVKKLGKGRFAHWDKWLIFAASDNSDPNINGKKYTYTLDY